MTQARVTAEGGTRAVGLQVDNGLHDAHAPAPLRAIHALDQRQQVDLGGPRLG